MKTYQTNLSLWKHDRREYYNLVAKKIWALARDDCERPSLNQLKQYILFEGYLGNAIRCAVSGDLNIAPWALANIEVNIRPAPGKHKALKSMSKKMLLYTQVQNESVSFKKYCTVHFTIYNYKSYIEGLDWHTRTAFWVKNRIFKV